jgi:glycogen debranching enzyme
LVQHRRIIKKGPIVLATAEDGSMDPTSPATHGIFVADTRFLSRFQVRLDNCEPLLLGSTEEELFHLSYLFTNPALDGIPPNSIGLLQRNSLEETDRGIADVIMTIGVSNWSGHSIKVEVSAEIEADFFDSFEARGVKRNKRGKILPPKLRGREIRLGYVGLDDVTDTTIIKSSWPIDRFENSRIFMPLALEAGARQELTLRFAMTSDAKSMHEEITPRTRPTWFDAATKFGVSDAVTRQILDRSCKDLEALMSKFPPPENHTWDADGTWVPVAGLPRFAVPFGRDSIFTGLETLSWNPLIARDTLAFLAERQGKEDNPWNYEQPGKIMHEVHTGELARLRAVPFGLFYGSVDSTPLFLILAAEYIRWTQDLEFYRWLRPYLDAAWDWINTSANIDGSGYIQYQAHTPPVASSGALTVGLFNQGWKDSSIAVVYSNGEIVRDHPIALAEVQGYLYRALQLWADLYRRMPQTEPDSARATQFAQRAADLKAKFNREFWMADKSFYAMALDGHHRPVDVITSNPGHCLWARLIDEEHAEAVADALTKPDMCSSWGIRTMSIAEVAFNAFSYHDGSIWPFENALIAAGLKKYGFVRAAQQVYTALLDASAYFEYQRWPEVYCGVTRDTAGVLARQPDACRPQAWSAGAIFLLIQTWLGIAPRPFSRHVDITPVLPAGLLELDVDDLAICGSVLGIRLVRENGSLLVEIKDNPGNLDIMIHPASRSERHLRGEDMPAQLR